MLKGTKWIVAGGTGSVGEGIVRSLLEKGATVVVPVRQKAKGEKLKEGLGKLGEKLHLIKASFGKPEEAAGFREAIQADHADTDAAVASIGGWWQGKPVSEVEWEDWHSVLQNSLSTHLVFMQSVYPVLQKRGKGMYVMINGGASTAPVPGSGPVSIAAAAQLMMARVLDAENEQEALRVHSLVLNTPIITRKNESMHRPEWIKATQVGDYLAFLYEGKTGMEEEVIHTLSGPKDIPSLA